MDERTCTEDFIIDLFCRIDWVMHDVRKHPQAMLWPSEIVTLAMLFVLKHCSERGFDRWARRELLHLFPHLPERTRLFRLFATHRDWSQRFLGQPMFFGITDSFGIELLRLRRLGRSSRQIAKLGFCGGRWIAGVKLGWVINSSGEVCAWDVTTANVYDADAFAHLVWAFQDQMIVLADCNFHKSPYHRKGDPDPPNLKICPRGLWNTRRKIETELSIVQSQWSLKTLRERAWKYVKAHLAFASALFNVLLKWDGHPKLSLARFSI
jgi:hypothetical protein